MSDSPRIVTEDVTFQWDGVTQRLPRGQVLDVAPDSALERAIGAQRLRPLGAVAPQPPAEQEAAQPQAEAEDEDEQAGRAPEEPAAAVRKPPAKAKAQDSDDKDGDS